MGGKAFFFAKGQGLGMETGRGRQRHFMLAPLTGRVTKVVCVLALHDVGDRDVPERLGTPRLVAQKLHQPEAVPNPVDDRRPSETPTPRRVQRAAGLGDYGRGVADLLRLVQDDPVEGVGKDRGVRVVFQIGLELTCDGVVRRDHDVHVLQVAEEARVSLPRCRFLGSVWGGEWERGRYGEGGIELVSVSGR